MRTLHRRQLLAGLLAAGAVACIPKPAPVTLQESVKIRTAGVLSGHADGVLALPEGMDRRLNRALDARGFSVDPVSAKELKTPMARQRTSGQRLAWLADNAGGSDAVMLVEVSAFYDTQIQGRMRWTVQATVSIAAADAPEAALQRDVNTAVFLQFLHQRESEAALEATTTIERAAARLLDDWVRAQE
jgi:hypothetical protein